MGNEVLIGKKVKCVFSIESSRYSNFCLLKTTDVNTSIKGCIGVVEFLDDSCMDQSLNLYIR